MQRVVTSDHLSLLSEAAGSNRSMEPFRGEPPLIIVATVRAMTDDDLVRQFMRTGEERAFRQLYALHTPAVYGLIRRLAGPMSDLADDVVQDAWLRAAAALPRFRGDSTFR